MESNPTDLAATTVARGVGDSPFEPWYGTQLPCLASGKAWTAVCNQPTAQFYHVAVDNHWPYRVYGAQQDNSTVAILSRDDVGVIGREDWYPVGGGKAVLSPRTRRIARSFTPIPIAVR